MCVTLVAFPFKCLKHSQPLLGLVVVHLVKQVSVQPLSIHHLFLNCFEKSNPLSLSPLIREGLSSVFMLCPRNLLSCGVPVCCTEVFLRRTLFSYKNNSWHRDTSVFRVGSWGQDITHWSVSPCQQQLASLHGIEGYWGVGLTLSFSGLHQLGSMTQRPEDPRLLPHQLPGVSNKQGLPRPGNKALHVLQSP